MGLFTKTKRTPHTAPSVIEAAQPIAPEQPTAKPKRKETRLGSLFMGDRVIWVVFFFLCIISLVEVYSAASTLAYKSGRFWDPLLKQALFLGVGTFIVVIVHRIPCRLFKALPVVLWIPSVIMLIATLLSGTATNEASRWMSFGFIQFQPSEIAKGTVVITVALILAQTQTKEGTNRKAMKLILFLSLIPILLIFPENLSTAALLFGVVVLMMFIGRVPLVQLGKLFGVMALIGVLAGMLVAISPQVSFLHRLETWKGRIEEHFVGGEEADRNNDPRTYDIDKKAQVAHANIAIASSNGIGKMPGNSVQRDFLSQAFSDFIFAVIIEEMGIWGAAIVVFLYIILLFRAGRIASRCERHFPPFLAMGLTLLLVSQAMLNMWVAVGLFPVTGQPLPLISRGGTSTLINCAYIGMILSVSRYAKQVKEPQHTQFDGPMTEIKHTDERRKA